MSLPYHRFSDITSYAVFLQDLLEKYLSHPHQLGIKSRDKLVLIHQLSIHRSDQISFELLNELLVQKH